MKTIFISIPSSIKHDELLLSKFSATFVYIFRLMITNDPFLYMQTKFGMVVGYECVCKICGTHVLLVLKIT
jgi:hypothetical protein